MDILYTSVCYPPRMGGGELHLHMVAKALGLLGHSTHVVNQWSRWRQDWLWGTTVFPDPPKEYAFEGVTVRQIGLSSLTRLRMLPWVMAYPGLMGLSINSISRLLKPAYESAAGKPDLIHAVRMGREFLLKTALDFGRSKGIPIVLTPVHHPRWHGFFYGQYDRLYRQMDALIALTEHEKKVLIEEKGVKPERVFITGIGPVLDSEYSADAFRESYNVRNPYVLFLGRQVQHKGFTALLKATPAVWRRFKDIDFVFIGPKTRQSERIFSNLHDPRIHNLGEVDLRTKTSALAGCLLFCLPSYQESFGGVYCEAWAFQKPVIGGNIPPIACVIDDSKDGLLADQDPGQLAEKIIYLIDYPAVAQAIGQAGYKKLCEHYSWDTILEKTLIAYRSVIPI